MNPPRLSVHAQVNRFDPTRTLFLRQQFMRKMASKFRELRGIVRKAIVQDDVFNLVEDKFKVFQLQSPGRKAFNAVRSQDKVAAFMGWLKRQEDMGILEVMRGRGLGGIAEAAWTDTYIRAAYGRGMSMGRQTLISEGWKVPTVAETGGIDILMQGPFHADRVGLLYTRVFEDLKGITATMDTQISRVLSEGLSRGMGTKEIAERLTKTISGPVGDLGITDVLGRFIPAERRAQLLAQTEIIRAHSEATLNEFESWGVEGVSLEAEFVNSNDERVCPECEALGGTIMTIEEARGVIPVHPGCRCRWIAQEIKKQVEGKK